MNTIPVKTAALAVLISSMTFGAASVKTDNSVLVPVKNDPTVCFRIWFKVGSQNDPAGKEGLAAITASMLTDGSTQKNSYEQILDKLYPLAAAYDATVSAEMTVVYGRVHKDNLAEYYPLLLDAMTAPAFAQQDLDRIKSQTLNYLENTLRYSSDEELGKAVLYNGIFAGTPYGHITAGLVSSVKSITLDDVRSFYRTYFTRDNLVIGLGGGYDASLLARLHKDLAALPAGKPLPVAPPVPAPLSGFRATIVEKDAPATAISMGFPIDILRGSKDWYALAIANSWLGEHRNSSSHLYQVIREERGLNYGDYSYIENFPEGGRRSVPPQNVCRRKQIFEIWIRPVPPEAGHFALRAALREYRHLVENGLTKEQFTLTRNFLRNYVLNYAPTTMARLGYAIDDRFYGIRGSHLAQFRAMMKTLTLADVNRAIKKHLHYGDMAIAVVTKDAKGFRDELVSDMPSPVTYRTKKPESVQNEDREIAVFPVKLAPGDVTVVPVTEEFR
ncbi:MAG TPA: pitrilysin family protein [Bacteroidota bacterium]|nr:pitrilysin family protein [Bacteroidota bacterium]